MLKIQKEDNRKKATSGGRGWWINPGLEGINVRFGLVVNSHPCQSLLAPADGLTLLIHLAQRSDSEPSLQTKLDHRGRR